MSLIDYSSLLYYQRALEITPSLWLFSQDWVLFNTLPILGDLVYEITLNLLVLETAFIEVLRVHTLNAFVF